MMTREISASRIKPARLRVPSYLAALASAFMMMILAVATAHAAPKANELVKITSALIEPSLKPGGTSKLKVAAKVVDGWHINSDKPFSEDYIPTKLAVNSPLTITPGTVKYPPAQTMTLEFAPSDKLSVFSGDIKLEVPHRHD